MKCWANRFLMILAFPLWNLIVLPFAIWFALQDSFLPYMALYGILPNEFMQAWRSYGKHKKEHTDAD